MWGSIIGDILGTPWEGIGIPDGVPLYTPTARYRFSDDTVCAMAVADVYTRTLSPKAGDMANSLRRWYARYPDVGYGHQFSHWAMTPGFPPYQSHGNGAAMRCPSIALCANTPGVIDSMVQAACDPTHDDPITVRSSQALVHGAYALWQDPRDIGAPLRYLYTYTGMEPSDLDDRIQRKEFVIENRWCVAMACTIVQRATDFDHGMMMAMACNRDTDTQASITGMLLEARFGVPSRYRDLVQRVIPQDAHAIIEACYARRIHPHQRPIFVD